MMQRRAVLGLAVPLLMALAGCRGGISVQTMSDAELTTADLLEKMFLVEDVLAKLLPLLEPLLAATPYGRIFLSVEIAVQLVDRVAKNGDKSAVTEFVGEIEKIIGSVDGVSATSSGSIGAVLTAVRTLLPVILKMAGVSETEGVMRGAPMLRATQGDSVAAEARLRAFVGR